MSMDFPGMQLCHHAKHDFMHLDLLSEFQRNNRPFSDVLFLLSSELKRKQVFFLSGGASCPDLAIHFATDYGRKGTIPLRMDHCVLCAFVHCVELSPGRTQSLKIDVTK